MPKPIKEQEEKIPTLEEWKDAWEAESNEGRTRTITWDEAEKRYYERYPKDNEPY